MTPLEVIFAETARDDLFDIWLYVSESTGVDRTADRYVDRIEAHSRKIGNAPRGGRSRDDLRPGLRVVPFEHTAVIADLIEGDRGVIVDVFHGGRDYDALATGDD